MALSREVMGGGFSSGQAQALGGGTNSAVASAGSVQGDGTVISTSSQIVTGADGTKGVTLPAAPLGDSVIVFNSSGSTLKVYPPSGAAIAVPGTGLGTTNAAYSHTTYACCEYFCVSSTQWLVQKSA